MGLSLILAVVRSALPIEPRAEGFFQSNCLAAKRELELRTVWGGLFLRRDAFPPGVASSTLPPWCLVYSACLLAGMASIDSSAPETTSSDNSPTVVRRSGWGRPCGPGSDSGSSGESSDSVVSSSSGDRATGAKARHTDRWVPHPPLTVARRFLSLQSSLIPSRKLAN